MNNFNTLMGVIAGVNTSSIGRLNLMKSDASARLTRQFAKLEALMSPQKNFSTYRNHLHECSPPLIPYMGVYLTDLTFIEDGNDDKIKETNLINFSKRELVYGIIEEVKQYQQAKYDVKAMEPIFTFLAKLPALPEKALYDLSLVREPRK